MSNLSIGGRTHRHVTLRSVGVLVDGLRQALRGSGGSGLSIGRKIATPTGHNDLHDRERIFTSLHPPSREEFVDV